MIEAYSRLHEEGWAHSIEVWRGDRLIGGLYGVAIGRVFFGESMFSGESNASKFALYALSQYLRTRGFPLIDCQVTSEHLARLGATMLPRTVFAQILKRACTPPERFDDWPAEALLASEISASADMPHCNSAAISAQFAGFITQRQGNLGERRSHSDGGCRH